MAPQVNSSTIIILFCLFFLIVPAAAENGDFSSATDSPATSRIPYGIRLFIPSTEMIHSDQIKDQINGLNGYDVLFATSFGLSTYNDTWSTRHMNLDNISAGLMDDYITAIEYDPSGKLWLGYSGGLQIFDGREFGIITDQQLLKDPRINDLQRWDYDMWVATGNAGIHRYRNGTWTWFQPMTSDGPGFYEIDSMVLDPASDIMLIATENQGLWAITSREDPVRFELLAGKNTPNGRMEHVRRDPHGGGYFFDDTTVVHYNRNTGFSPVLTIKDLSPKEITINDIAAAPDGKLYVATDDGLFVWYDGAIYRHLSRFEGIGTSHIVRTVFMDTQNRVWFSTQGFVGYYVDLTEPETIIGIEMVTATEAQPSSSSMGSPRSTGTGSSPVPTTNTVRPSPTPVKKGSSSDPLSILIDSFSEIFSLKFFTD